MPIEKEQDEFRFLHISGILSYDKFNILFCVSQ